MKKNIIFLMIIFSSLCLANPMEDIYKNLDITSFPSSLMPMTQGNKDRFSELKQVPKPVIKNSVITIEDESWLYEITFVKENRHGIHICFLDHARKSSYDAQKPMVIRKYGERYVAIRLYSDVCEEFAR
ncbi:hypothetical protein A8139_18020 [Marinomonas primoryensis]|jgi:hypothetical protein|uniref:Pesticin immunity protein n=1 Tax=Marinomonas primoryensis TaxID=178399 RepID=A0A2Z4PWX7_9GAMM|nr:hypothetical protein [Marinomonas primoryensis]AWY01649.1 hypothetical protein A8139_18020 [Marinomonas primoryensis]